MKKLTIEIPEQGDERNYFDLVDEAGRRTGGLTWDEMLGQVASMTIRPRDLGEHYRMQTAEDWQRESDERAARTARRNETTTPKENHQ